MMVVCMATHHWCYGHIEGRPGKPVCFKLDYVLAFFKVEYGNHCVGWAAGCIDNSFLSLSVLVVVVGAMVITVVIIAVVVTVVIIAVVVIVVIIAMVITVIIIVMLMTFVTGVSWRESERMNSLVHLYL